MLYSTPIPIDNLSELSNSLFRFIPKKPWPKSLLFPVDPNEILARTPLRAVLEKYNWVDSIEGISVVVVPGKQILPIHHDWGTLTHSLNIPILNCVNTWTIWYKIDEGEETVRPGSYTIYDEDKGEDVTYTFYEYCDTKCTEVERLELVTPHLLNVRQPHSVWNPTIATRLVLAVRLMPDFQRP